LVIASDGFIWSARAGRCEAVDGNFASQRWQTHNGGCPAFEVTLRMLRAGSGATLERDSAIGVSYRLETSSDLVTWTNADALGILGTGVVVAWPVPSLAEPRPFYRLRVIAP
jgi:hypothetical protein